VNEELPFQTGRTDRNGLFLFLPDQPGDWKVVARDEMGHRLAVKPIIDEDMNPNKTGGQTDGAVDGGFLPRYEKAFMGLSLIFGISGVFFWWRGRRLYRRIDKARSRPTESPNIEGPR
jgi:nickel transport protein